MRLSEYIGVNRTMKSVWLWTALACAGAAMYAQAPVPVAAHAVPVFFHFDFRRSLQMRRKLAGGIFGFALLLSIAYAAKTWNNFFADSIVYVQPSPPKLMENGPTQRWPYDANTYESYIQQQIHNVTRPDVLMEATRRIPNWAFTGESPQAAALRLGLKIEVTRVGAGYQLNIRAKAKDPQRAAVMANAVATSFIESSTKELRAGDTQRIEILREERERIQKELASDRAEQEDLNKKLGIAAVSGAIPDPIDEQISAIRGELVKARTDNDEAAARLTAATRGKGNETALDAQAEETAASDAGLVSMKTALNKRRSELITQMSNLTPNHPLYKQDSDELAHINDSLDKMSREVHVKAAQQIEQKLKADLDRTSSVESKLNAQLSQMIASAGNATPRLQRFNDLTTDIQRLQQRFATVDEQYSNLTLENNAPGAVYLSSPATAPLGADRSKTLRICIIVIVVGLVLALGAALTAQNLDKRIYTATDVERVLGFAPMAQLPDFVEVGTGVSEEYMLRLAAAVEHAHQQGALKSCIFTGVAAGAGATTVVKRVTGMLEAMGREIVLVDAAGAASAPASEQNSTSATGRDLVPTRGGRSTALLQQMAEEMNEDTIVLSDTAPLLVSGETEYMARFVDSAIVVIESGVTTRDQLRQAADTLQRLDVSAVGFVLNRVSMHTADAAFRDSVQAVQRHVNGQTRVASREADKPGPANLNPAPQPPAAAPEPVTTRVPEPLVAAPAPQPAPNVPRTEPPSRPPASVSGAALPRGRQVNDVPAVKAAGTPERKPEPEPSPRTSEQPTWVAPTPANAPASAAPAHPRPEPAATFVPPRMPVAAPIDPIPGSRRAAAEQPAAPAATAPAAPLVIPAPEPVSASSAMPDLRPDEVPYSAASRLGGLRNLLVSLGLNTLNRDGDVAIAELPADRPAERPVYPEPYRPAAAAAGDPQPGSVRAAPEFLPPRMVAEPVEEKEPEPARTVKQPTSARPDQNDEIETLPSWRGQYRKRR